MEMEEINMSDDDDYVGDSEYIFILRINRVYRENVIDSLERWFSDDDLFDVLEDYVSDDSYVAFCASSFPDRTNFRCSVKGVLKVFDEHLKYNESTENVSEVEMKCTVGDPVRILNDDMFKRGTRGVIKDFGDDGNVKIEIVGDGGMKMERWIDGSDLDPLR